MDKPTFNDVDFLREYPTGRVAEHEVFMSFNGDDEAVAFQEWWHAEGSSRFAKWFNKRNTHDGK